MYVGGSGHWTQKQLFCNNWDKIQETLISHYQSYNKIGNQKNPRMYHAQRLEINRHNKLQQSQRLLLQKHNTSREFFSFHHWIMRFFIPLFDLSSLKNVASHEIYWHLCNWMCLVHSFICLGAILCACVLLGMHARLRKETSWSCKTTCLRKSKEVKLPNPFGYNNDYWNL